MSLFRKHNLTASARLRPLLSWVNGDPVSALQVRFGLLGFVGSFDGSAAAGFVDVSLARQVARLDEPHPEPTGTLAEQLETLRLTLRDVLQADAEARSFPSLRFSVRRVRPPAKRSKLKPRERQAYQDAGAAVLRVEGSLMDLVPFLLMHLLTAPDMMTVARCPAPQAGHWRDRCGRWFVQATGRGRPREYCTDPCRVRANYAKSDEQTPTPRRRKRS
jgi:hypothetical protein